MAAPHPRHQSKLTNGSRVFLGGLSQTLTGRNNLLRTRRYTYPLPCSPALLRLAKLPDEGRHRPIEPGCTHAESIIFCGKNLCDRPVNSKEAGGGVFIEDKLVSCSCVKALGSQACASPTSRTGCLPTASDFRKSTTSKNEADLASPPAYARFVIGPGPLSAGSGLSQVRPCRSAPFGSLSRTGENAHELLRAD